VYVVRFSRRVRRLPVLMDVECLLDNKFIPNAQTASADQGHLSAVRLARTFWVLPEHTVS